jgi:hypothetical protein
MRWTVDTKALCYAGPAKKEHGNAKAKGRREKKHSPPLPLPRLPLVLLPPRNPLPHVLPIPRLCLLPMPVPVRPLGYRDGGGPRRGHPTPPPRMPTINVHIHADAPVPIRRRARPPSLPRQPSPREERDDGGGGGGAKVFSPGRSMDLRFGRNVGPLASLPGVVTGVPVVPAAELEERVCARGGRAGFPFGAGVTGAVGLDPPFAGEEVAVRVGVEGGIGVAEGETSSRAEAGRSLRATLLWRGMT